MSAGELARFAFIEPHAVAVLATPLVGRQIAACLEALAGKWQPGRLSHAIGDLFEPFAVRV